MPLNRVETVTAEGPGAACGSWINEQTAGPDGSDARVMLRYDFPVI